MKCPQCGIVVPDKDRFCELCGTDLHPERTYQANNPYQQYKQRQAGQRKEEERRRRTEMVTRRQGTETLGADEPAEEPARRAPTKKIPPRKIGKAVRAAAKPTAGRRVPDWMRRPLMASCGVLAALIMSVYTWNYGVGYSSPHQLVLDFDVAIRGGEYKRANALAEGSLAGELMLVVSRASLAETYMYHVARPDESTRQIEYDDFTINLRRSMGKWTLTVRKKSKADRAPEIW